MWSLCVCACGAGFDEDGQWYDVQRPAAYQSGAALLQDAELKLIQHNVRGAQQVYQEARAENDPFVVGTAAAGQSLTDMLLIGDREPVKDLLIKGFGVTNTTYDTQRLIWAREGVLDWFQQGGRWDDDGAFLGVRSLVASELPWTPETLDTPMTFVSGLSAPVGDLNPEIIDVAMSLRDIEANIQIALNDPKFEYLYIPAALFHDDALSFALNKSDMAALHGAVSMARGALYLFTAYTHQWSLSQLIAQDIEPDEFTVDYAALDVVWLREVQQKGSLREAKRAFQDGFDLLAQSITLGLAQEQPSALTLIRWDGVERSDLRILRDLLQSLSYSLDEPTKLPHFSEDFTLDLSMFFSGDGRVLSMDLSWFTYDESTQEWSLTQDAEQQFFLDGVFSPEARAGEDYATFALSEDQLDELLTKLTQQTNDRISEAFGL